MTRLAVSTGPWLPGFFAEYGKAAGARDPLGGLTTAIVVGLGRLTPVETRVESA